MTSMKRTASDAARELNASDVEDGAVRAFHDGVRHYLDESSEMERLVMRREAHQGLREMNRFDGPWPLPQASMIDVNYWEGVLVASREVSL